MENNLSANNGGINEVALSVLPFFMQIQSY